MRTKALLLGAMIGAGSLVTSMAQVYSVNIVGYVNVSIPHGFSIIANPLNATPNNQIGSVLPTPPQPITVYKFVNATGLYNNNNYDTDFGWDDTAMDVSPGIGLFVYNGGSPITVTLVGEVATGTVNVPLYHGFNLVSSIIPQAGLLQTELGYVPSVGAGDTVYKFNNATGLYNNFAYDVDFGWDVEPSLAVAEGCFIFRGQTATANWSRTFTVGP